MSDRICALTAAWNGLFIYHLRNHRSDFIGNLVESTIRRMGMHVLIKNWVWCHGRNRITWLSFWKNSRSYRISVFSILHIILLQKSLVELQWLILKRGPDKIITPALLYFLFIKPLKHSFQLICEANVGK